MPHGDLEVYLEGAQNIKDTSFIGKGSPYAILTVGTQAQTSDVAGGGSKPYWNNTFNFKIDRSTSDLNIQVKRKNILRDDDVLGESTLAFSQVFREKHRVAVTSYPIIRSGRPHGEIRLGLNFYPKRGPEHLEPRHQEAPSPGPVFQRPPPSYNPQSLSPNDSLDRASSFGTDDDSFNDGSSRRSRFPEQAENYEGYASPVARSRQPSHDFDGPGRRQSLPASRHPPAPHQMQHSQSLPAPARDRQLRPPFEAPLQSKQRRPKTPIDAQVWSPQYADKNEPEPADHRGPQSRYGSRHGGHHTRTPSVGEGRPMHTAARHPGPVHHSASPPLGNDEIRLAATHLNTPSRMGPVVPSRSSPGDYSFAEMPSPSSMPPVSHIPTANEVDNASVAPVASKFAPGLGDRIPGPPSQQIYQPSAEPVAPVFSAAKVGDSGPSDAANVAPQLSEDDGPLYKSFRRRPEQREPQSLPRLSESHSPAPFSKVERDLDSESEGSFHSRRSSLSQDSNSSKLSKSHERRKSGEVAVKEFSKSTDIEDSKVPSAGEGYHPGQVDLNLQTQGERMLQTPDLVARADHLRPSIPGHISGLDPGSLGHLNRRPSPRPLLNLGGRGPHRPRPAFRPPPTHSQVRPYATAGRPGPMQRPPNNVPPTAQQILQGPRGDELDKHFSPAARPGQLRPPSYRPEGNARREPPMQQHPGPRPLQPRRPYLPGDPQHEYMLPTEPGVRPIWVRPGQPNSGQPNMQLQPGQRMQRPQVPPVKMQSDRARLAAQYGRDITGEPLQLHRSLSNDRPKTGFTPPESPDEIPAQVQDLQEFDSDGNIQASRKSNRPTVSKGSTRSATSILVTGDPPKPLEPTFPLEDHIVSQTTPLAGQRSSPEPVDCADESENNKEEEAVQRGGQGTCNVSAQAEDDLSYSAQSKIQGNSSVELTSGTSSQPDTSVSAYQVDGSFSISQELTMEKTVEPNVTVERSISVEESVSIEQNVSIQRSVEVETSYEVERSFEAEASYEVEQSVEVDTLCEVERSIEVEASYEVEQSVEVASTQDKQSVEVAPVYEVDQSVDVDTLCDVEQTVELETSYEQSVEVEASCQETAEASYEQNVDLEASYDGKSSFEENVEVEASYDVETSYKESVGMEASYEADASCTVEPSNQQGVEVEASYEGEALHQQNMEVETLCEENVEVETVCEVGGFYDVEILYEQNVEIETSEENAEVDASYEQNFEVDASYEAEAPFEVDVSYKEDAEVETSYVVDSSYQETYGRDVTYQENYDGSYEESYEVNASYQENHDARVSYEHQEYTERMTYTGGATTVDQEVYQDSIYYQEHDVSGYGLALRYQNQTDDVDDCDSDSDEEDGEDSNSDKRGSGVKKGSSRSSSKSGSDSEDDEVEKIPQRQGKPGKQVGSHQSRAYQNDRDVIPPKYVSRRQSNAVSNVAVQNSQPSGGSGSDYVGLPQRDRIRNSEKGIFTAPSSVPYQDMRGQARGRASPNQSRKPVGKEHKRPIHMPAYYEEYHDPSYSDDSYYNNQANPSQLRAMVAVQAYESNEVNQPVTLYYEQPLQTGNKMVKGFGKAMNKFMSGVATVGRNIVPVVAPIGAAIAGEVVKESGMRNANNNQTGDNSADAEAGQLLDYAVAEAVTATIDNALGPQGPGQTQIMPPITARGRGGGRAPPGWGGQAMRGPTGGPMPRGLRPFGGHPKGPSGMSGSPRGPSMRAQYPGPPGGHPMEGSYPGYPIGPPRGGPSRGPPIERPMGGPPRRPPTGMRPQGPPMGGPLGGTPRGSPMGGPPMRGTPRGLPQRPAGGMHPGMRGAPRRPPQEY